MTWHTQSLPSTNCFSGQYTLRLAVEDTMANLYYDTQQIWFDNKPIYGEITGILGVPSCAVINLSDFNAGNCNVVWQLAIQGIAYDEYILEGDTTHPSDNFGGYCLTVTRQGGQSQCAAIVLSVALPVPAPASPATVGTNRVGDPGVRCASASPPAMPPAKFSNTLTTMDARMFDAVCGANAMPQPPAGFALKRGECCSFFLALDFGIQRSAIKGPWAPSTADRHLAGLHMQRSAPAIALADRNDVVRSGRPCDLRVTHLLANEDGPADLVVRVRSFRASPAE